MISRRRFLTGVAIGLAPIGAAAHAQEHKAQQAGKVYRVGWLSFFGEPRPTFREAMRELGYVEGKTVVFEARNADGRSDRMPELVAELITSKVDIIVASAPPAILAAKDATRSIPIVMAYWGGPDLVESGVIASFARPGGNVTGVHMLSSVLDAKRLDLLVQAVPAARKVAVLGAESPSFEPQLIGIGLREVAPRLRVELHFVLVGGAEGYEAGFDSIARAGAGALVVLTAPKFERDRKLIFDLAARRRVPAIYFWGYHLTIPPSLLGRADEIIQ